jgi:cation transport regulator ChaC
MSGFTLDLSPGELGIVGYGSLFSRSSLEGTLRRSYDRPMFECLIPGWRRAWNVVMPNSRFFTLNGTTRNYPGGIIYLNVRPDATSVLNGVLFVVTEAEVAALDDREWVYSRVEVTNTIANVAVSGGKVFMYAGLTEHVFTKFPESPTTAAVRKTYLQIIESGLKNRDIAFQSRYLDSTDNLPEHLVIDDHVDPGEPAISQERGSVGIRR